MGNMTAGSYGDDTEISMPCGIAGHQKFHAVWDFFGWNSLGLRSHHSTGFSHALGTVYL